MPSKHYTKEINHAFTHTRSNNLFSFGYNNFCIQALSCRTHRANMHLEFFKDIVFNDNKIIDHACRNDINNLYLFNSIVFWRKIIFNFSTEHSKCLYFEIFL